MSTVTGITNKKAKCKNDLVSIAKLSSENVEEYRGEMKLIAIFGGIII